MEEGGPESAWPAAWKALVRSNRHVRSSDPGRGSLRKRLCQKRGAHLCHLLDKGTGPFSRRWSKCAKGGLSPYRALASVPGVSHRKRRRPILGGHRRREDPGTHADAGRTGLAKGKTQKEPGPGSFATRARPTGLGQVSTRPSPVNQGGFSCSPGGTSALPWHRLH